MVWDTVAWVRVSPFAGLLGETPLAGLECPPELDCLGGHFSLG